MRLRLRVIGLLRLPCMGIGSILVGAGMGVRCCCAAAVQYSTVQYSTVQYSRVQ